VALVEPTTGVCPPIAGTLHSLTTRVVLPRSYKHPRVPVWLHQQLVPQQATFAPSRRPARPLAAPAESPSTSSTRTSGRHAESTHRTPLLDGQTLADAALVDHGQQVLAQIPLKCNDDGHAGRYSPPQPSRTESWCDDRRIGGRRDDRSRRGSRGDRALRVRGVPPVPHVNGLEAITPARSRRRQGPARGGQGAGPAACRRRRVFASFNLFAHRTVLENVMRGQIDAGPDQGPRD
jgi:hypothetical protein